MTLIMTPGQWFALAEHFAYAALEPGDRIELQEQEPYPGTIGARIRSAAGTVEYEVDVEPDPSEGSQ